MSQPGERRPPSATPPPRPRPAAGPDRLRPTSLPVALLEATLVGLVAAGLWALIHGVLEFPGALAVAVVGGWLIGEVLWSVRAHALVAVAMAALAWLAGLVLSWMVAMALIQGSSFTFLERLGNTPFLAWLGPQFGWLQAAGLVLYLAAALYGARPRAA